MLFGKPGAKRQQKLDTNPCSSTKNRYLKIQLVPTAAAPCCDYRGSKFVFVLPIK